MIKERALIFNFLIYGKFKDKSPSHTTVVCFGGKEEGEMVNKQYPMKQNLSLKATLSAIKLLGVILHCTGLPPGFHQGMVQDLMNHLRLEN